MKSKNIYCICFLLVFILFYIPGECNSYFIKSNLNLLAQNENNDKIEKDKPTNNNNDVDKNDTTNKKIIRYSVLIGAPAIMYGFALSAWGWGDRSTWLWANEGWFGKNTYEGGADKTAHIYSHYLIMRTSYSIFNYTENGGKRKWLYSIGLTSAMGLAIELGDAFAGQNGFAWEDLVVDGIGIGIGALLERYPIADNFVGISAEYVPTKYFRQRPSKRWLFPDDYSGWKFMINFKLAGFKYAGFNAPEFLKYIMLDLGYYARGYTKYDRRSMYKWNFLLDPSIHALTYTKYGKNIGLPQRKRYMFFGISVNLMEVVKDFFEDKESLACRAAQQPFKYYHVPLGVKFKDEIK